MTFNEKERTVFEYELLFGMRDQVLLFESMCGGKFTPELREWLEQKVKILQEELPDEY